MTASAATNGAVAPVALITGTSSGFGYELARQALARGIRVIATARKLSDMAELEKLGAKTLQLDVSAPAEELTAIVKDAKDIYGQIDYLVNNAGYSVVRSVEDETPEDLQMIFQVNFFGAVNLTRALLPHFRERRTGTVINISSVSGVGSFPGMSSYGSVKAAMTSFTETLSAEGAAYGIRSIAILPGLFRTKILEKDIFPAADKLHESSPYAAMYKAGQEWIKSFDSIKIGDPVKGVERIWDVVQSDKPLPSRLALGQQAFDALVQDAEDKKKALLDNKELSLNVEFE